MNVPWVGFCPRKPHGFGTEYHSICWGVSGIIFDTKLVEGKDHTVEIPPDFYGNIGKVVKLLVKPCCNFYSTSKVVILGSVLCVLQGIIDIIKLGF